MIKCPECGKWFKSLGYARHRTMHYEKRRAANQGDSKNNPQQTKATILCPACHSSDIYHFVKGDEHKCNNCRYSWIA